MDHNRSAQKNNQPPAEKPLPRAEDCERYLLGAILDDYQAYGHIIDKLVPRDFPIERDRQILAAMVRLRTRENAIDRATLRYELDEAGHLANVTISYISQLTEGIPEKAHVEDWFAIVKEKTGQRDLIQQGEHMANQGTTGFSVAEIIQTTQQQLNNIQKRTIANPVIPRMTARQLVMDTSIELPSMAVEGLLVKHALNMTYGAQRSGKTLLTSQIGIAIADGQKWLLGTYAINIEGPVLFIQADDPNEGASMKKVLLKTPVTSVLDKDFIVMPKFGLKLGDEFYGWLESEIKLYGYVFVALDSWMKLRAERHGGDIVKAEADELGALAEVAHRTRCTLDLIHHESQSSKRVSSHWTERAAGTYAVGGGPAMHIHVSRFPDLDDKAPERLVHARGRHTEGDTFAMRFQEATLDHELIMAGSAAALYPLLKKLQSEFGGNVFKPNEVVETTGMSRQTVTRQMEMLRSSGKVRRVKFGEYVLAETVP